MPLQHTGGNGDGVGRGGGKGLGLGRGVLSLALGGVMSAINSCVNIRSSSLRGRRGCGDMGTTRCGTSPPYPGGTDGICIASLRAPIAASRVSVLERDVNSVGAGATGPEGNGEGDIRMEGCGAATGAGADAGSQSDGRGGDPGMLHVYCM